LAATGAEQQHLAAERGDLGEIVLVQRIEARHAPAGFEPLRLQEQAGLMTQAVDLDVAITDRGNDVLADGTIEVKFHCAGRVCGSGSGLRHTAGFGKIISFLRRPHSSGAARGA